jgi:DNA repair protein RadC
MPRSRRLSGEDVSVWPRPAYLDGACFALHEELWIAALDVHDRARGARMISRGGLLSASVRTADVLRAALELGAVTFVMAHNHPGGDPAPSADDVLLTQEVEHAAHLIDVPLRDHVIVTPAGRFSSVFRAGSPR